MEIAGAQVIPLIHDLTEEQLIPLLDKINGVLFTGGGLDLVDPKTGEYHIYTKTSEMILKYAINRTDQGDYFPLIGICQGFQLLNILRSKDRFVLKKSPSLFKNDTINAFTTFEESRWFKSLDENAEWQFSGHNLIVNLHNWGIHLSDYGKRIINSMRYVQS